MNSAQRSATAVWFVCVIVCLSQSAWAQMLPGKKHTKPRPSGGLIAEKVPAGGNPSVVSCTDNGPCSQTFRVCNENWGICVASSCAGKLDFTPCEVITSPDRSYDICVSGVCVSPGCGDVSCNTPGPHFPLSDTNQRTCFFNNNTCGEQYFGQDPQYGWDLTHSVSERFSRDLSVANEPVVKDNVTGLLWQGCPHGNSGEDCTGGSVIMAGWSEQLANCDGLSWGGHTDWRLPDPHELQTIVDRGDSSSPAIDGAAFPNVVHIDALPAVSNSLRYWTSAAGWTSTDKPRSVSFSTSAASEAITPEAMSARCVRGDPTPKPSRYTKDTTVSDNPVFVDRWTGLSWQGCTYGRTGEMCGDVGTDAALSWVEALSYCEGLVWAGQSDWRLPNAIELQSISDYRYQWFASAGDAPVFPSSPKYHLWSSTRRAPFSTSQVWAVSPSGSVYPMNSTGASVRCVRGGQ